jgi:glutamate--cysteine ligase
MQIFTQAGLNVRLGSLDEAVTGAHRAGPARRQRADARAAGAHPRPPGLKDFDPCTILLNNDLSAGVPRVLQNLHEQYLLPPLHAGWAVRRKSQPLPAYEEVAKKFAKLLGMDPWLINPMYGQCGEVNFARGRRAGVRADATSTRC